MEKLQLLKETILNLEVRHVSQMNQDNQNNTEADIYFTAEPTEGPEVSGFFDDVQTICVTPELKAAIELEFSISDNPITNLHLTEEAKSANIYHYLWTARHNLIEYGEGQGIELSELQSFQGRGLHYMMLNDIDYDAFMLPNQLCNEKQVFYKLTMVDDFQELKRFGYDR